LIALLLLAWALPLYRLPFAGTRPLFQNLELEIEGQAGSSLQFGWSDLYALAHPIVPFCLRSSASRFFALFSHVIAQTRFLIFCCCWLAWTALFLRLRQRLQPKEKS
jgi:hypothetical protein